MYLKFTRGDRLIMNSTSTIRTAVGNNWERNLFGKSRGLVSVSIYGKNLYYRVKKLIKEGWRWSKEPEKYKDSFQL